MCREVSKRREQRYYEKERKGKERKGKERKGKERKGRRRIDGKLLSEHPPCSDFRIMDDVSFGRIDKQVGLYYRADTVLSDSARRFVALCQRFWSQ